ncbi:MAG: sulfite exporter TauE/SafE family protein [Candidatus Binatia bacterium]
MIRALVASPLGLLVGLSLGVLGSGGSILAVPALVHAAGQTPQEATATSLLLVGVASLSGLPAHYRAGRVKLAPGIAFGLTGIGGSFAGTAFGRRLDPDVLLLAFAGLILVAAWRMLTACPSCTRTGEEAALAASMAGGTTSGISAGRVLMFVAAGTGIGFLTGLFGVGGGFVIVPALTLMLGFAMPQAIGTSMLVVAINAAIALAARAGTAHIDWSVAFAFTAMAVVGVLAGARIADRIDAERSLRYFAAGLVLLAIFTGGSALAGML